MEEPFFMGYQLGTISQKVQNKTLSFRKNESRSYDKQTRHDETSALINPDYSRGLNF